MGQRPLNSVVHCQDRGLREEHWKLVETVAGNICKFNKGVYHEGRHRSWHPILDISHLLPNLLCPVLCGRKSVWPTWNTSTDLLWPLVSEGIGQLWSLSKGSEGGRRGRSWHSSASSLSEVGLDLAVSSNESHCFSSRGFSTWFFPSSPSQFLPVSSGPWLVVIAPWP